MASAPARRGRPWLATSLAAALAATALLLPGTAAHAQPTLEEIEGQIDQAWRELEPLIEEYNRVRSELAANQEKSEQLGEEIAPLELKVSIAASELDEIVARQYMGGQMSAFNSLLTSGSPTRFMEQLTLLDYVAREQREQIDAARAVRADYEQQKADIDALIAEQEEQKADLEQRTAEIEDELARLEDLREQAQAQQASPPASDPGGLYLDSCPAAPASGAGATAAGFACDQIGKPYAWGAAGPDSYDCSGLTQAAWAAAGVSLTHYTGAQWNEGVPVSRAEARPGDLVFFYDNLSHVGLYVGNGLMVHAPQAGDVVRMRDIDIMPIAGFRRPG